MNSVWIYPWDLQDEGIANVLDRLQANNIQGLNVVVIYHSGMFFLPHNPKRKLYFPQPGALYFPPDKWYEQSAIKPPVSEFASKAFWDELREETLKRNMKLTAWSLALHNSFIGFNYPETNVVNAFGDRYPTALCPTNEALRDFLLHVYEDLAKNYGFDNILIESLEYMPFRHGYHHEVFGVPVNPLIDFFMSLSFSPGIYKKAAEQGIDLDKVRNFVKVKCEEAFNNPFSQQPTMSWEEIRNAADGQMGAYLDLRENLLADLMKEIKEVISANSKAMVSALDFGPLYGLGPSETSWQNGVNLEKHVPYLDQIHPTFYFTDPEVLKAKVAEYFGVIAKLSKPVEIVPAIRAILPQVGSQEDLRVQISCLRDRCSSFTFYNYGFMAYEVLEWIGRESK